MPTAVSTAEPFSREIPPDDIAYQVREFHVLQIPLYAWPHMDRSYHCIVQTIHIHKNSTGIK